MISSGKARIDEMARAKKDGEFINCKIRQDVIDRLNRYSDDSMISKTNIVEKAIEEYRV